MAFDPEELVTLTDHGTMKLRSAVSRAMTMPTKERKRATIVREGDPAILNFEQIKGLAAQWHERLCAHRLGSPLAISDRAAPPLVGPRHGPVTPTDLTMAGPCFCASADKTRSGASLLAEPPFGDAV